MEALRAEERARTMDGVTDGGGGGGGGAGAVSVARPHVRRPHLTCFAECMERTLDWLDAEFGGINGWLTSVGFGPEEVRAPRVFLSGFSDGDMHAESCMSRRAC